MHRRFKFLAPDARRAVQTFFLGLDRFGPDFPPCGSISRRPRRHNAPSNASLAAPRVLTGGSSRTRRVAEIASPAPAQSLARSEKKAVIHIIHEDQRLR